MQDLAISVDLLTVGPDLLAAEGALTVDNEGAASSSLWQTGHTRTANGLNKRWLSLKNRSLVMSDTYWPRSASRRFKRVSRSRSLVERSRVWLRLSRSPT